MGVLEIIADVARNAAVTVPFLSWFAAQAVKTSIDAVFGRKFDFRRFFGSGGMPSSHTSYVVALASVVGKREGVGSTLFAVCAAFAIVVMYDAAGVRRAAGKQAKVLNALLSTHYPGEEFNERLKELLGHKPLEVLVGAVFGLLFGVIMG